MPIWALIPWKLLALTAAIGGAAWVGYDWSYSRGAAAVQADWAAEKAAQAEATQRLEAAYRAKEQQWAGKVTFWSKAYEDVKQARKAELDSTLADLQSDNLRLRDRFKACAKRRVPSATTAPGDDHGGEEGGLSRQDEEFLIRIAAEANDVADQLSACQRYIEVLHD